MAHMIRRCLDLTCCLWLSGLTDPRPRFRVVFRSGYRYTRSSDSATQAGLSCPSISMVLTTVN